MKHEVVVTGAGGMLGKAVVKALEHSERYTPIPFTSRQLDITDSVRVISEMFDYNTIINCAGIVRGREGISAKRMGEVNGTAPRLLSALAGRLIHVSTDCVFDGTKGPYVESDEPTPADNYGMSKLIGEINQAPHLTVRTSFIGFGQRGLLRWVLDQPEGATIPGFRRWLWNGLYVETVARHLVRLLDDPMTGIVHIEGPRISKYDLLERLTETIRPDITVSPAIVSNTLDKNMILKSERLVWGDAPDTTFSWDIMMAELGADYEVEQANQMLASGGDPEGPPGIGI